MRIQARHYRTGELVEIGCAGGRIQSITELTEEPTHAVGWVAPGLFDLQINGCLGISFTSAALTPADVRQVVDVCRQHGIAQLCPTLTTESASVLAHGMVVIHQACEQDSVVRSAVAGIHLE